MLQGICRICGDSGRVDKSSKCPVCSKATIWLYRAKQPCNGASVKKLSDVFKEKFKNSDGSCEICGRLGSDLFHGLVLDHNHTTNKIRGLLCGPCNNSLRDNIFIINAMAAYLEKYDSI